MVIDVNDENIKEILDSELSVLQFSADWCGPCRMLTPRVVEISDLNSEVSIGKVNVDNAKDIALDFKIRNIPVMIYFKDGVEVNRVVGVASVADIQSKIDELKN